MVIGCGGQEPFLRKIEGIALGCIVSTMRHNGLVRRCVNSLVGTEAGVICVQI